MGFTTDNDDDNIIIIVVTRNTVLSTNRSSCVALFKKFWIIRRLSRIRNFIRNYKSREKKISLFCTLINRSSVRNPTYFLYSFWFNLIWIRKWTGLNLFNDDLCSIKNENICDYPFNLLKRDFQWDSKFIGDISSQQNFMLLCLKK